MMKSPPQKFITGYEPSVYAREGLVLGLRNPLTGPVFETLEWAQHWRIHVIADHYERGLGMSDAKISPFKGLVDRSQCKR